MKNLLHFAIIAVFTGTAFAQTARVQVIHNSADAAAGLVDVYLDAGLLLDDFAFRTASPFVDAPAGVEVELSVAPSTSTSVGDAIYTVAVTLTADETYILVADGIVSMSGYNPPQAFGLQVYAAGREVASNPANVDVLVHHGATDAPTVDIVETAIGAGTLVDDISYTEFQGYLELPSNDYVIEIRLADGTTGVAAYAAPLAALGLDGSALTVVASGFLDPSQNSNGPAFGLFAASVLGGPLLELPAAALGVAEFNSERIAMYPNPTNNKVTIDLAGTELSDYRISIADITGRVIDSKEYKTLNNTIDVSQLAAGIYTVSISEGNRVLSTTKLVKE
jgi:hypothetical protein